MNAIELKNVTKYFKDGDDKIEALKPTNFSVKKGEFVAIIGPSGSGKSTLLTIAGGLQAPSEGEVLVNGNSFSGKKENARAKLRFEEIGFILQASNLVPFLTVKKQLQLLSSYKQRQREIIDTAIRSEWQGLFPPKGRPQAEQCEVKFNNPAEDMERIYGKS